MHHYLGGVEIGDLAAAPLVLGLSADLHLEGTAAQLARPGLDELDAIADSLEAAP